MKNIKLWDWVVWNQRFMWKIIEYFMLLKKKIFFLCMYKMLPIRKEEYEKCEVEIIDKEKYFWVNRNYLEVESDFANWAQIFDKCDPKNKNTEIN